MAAGRGCDAVLRLLNSEEANQAAYNLLCNYLALLEELCDMVKNSSLCGLGQTAPNPVLSTLKYFRHEYEAHIDHKNCPAGVCKMRAAAEVRA